MNSTRNLKQQEKYDNMLKRKNKEKNIYKSKNSTLRIEKMNLIKAIERKDKEIKRLNNNWNKLKKWIEEYLNGTGLSEYETGISDALYDTLKKMKELQGSDKK